MARVHHVASSRTPHTCKAGHVIDPPEGYSWAAPGFRGSKRFACKQHPFRPSELTNGAASSVLAAGESAEDALAVLDPSATAEDFESIRDEFVSAAEELLDERESALSEWENGNSQLEELRVQASECVDAMSNHQVDEYPGDDGPEEGGDDWEPSDEYAEWFEEQRDALSEAISEATGNL